MCKPIEGIFGWMNTAGSFRKTRFVGQAKTQFAAYIPQRITRLQATTLV